MFDILFDLIDIVTQNNIVVMALRMMTVVKPLMASLVVLYAIYLAYKALFDAQNMVVMESLNFLGSLALATTVAFSIPWYMGHIVPTVLNSGDGIVNVLLNPPAGTTAGTLQIMSNKIGIQLDVLYDSIDMSITSASSIGHGIMTYVQIAFLYIASIPFLAICTAYLVVAKIMVSFLLIIGPLFIMFAFFPSTREFFKAWTSQVVNYLLLSILFPIAFTMFGAILDATVFSGNVNSSTVFASLILFFVLSFVAIQIPTLASSLSGGIGINGLVGSVAGVAGGAARLMRRSKGNSQPSPPKTPKGESISAG